MARSCLFCGGAAGSREHVLPAWLQGAVPVALPVTHVVRDPDGSVARQWGDTPFRNTTKAVCHHCNVGWMSGLEDRAKPLLTPMLVGAGYLLSPAEQGVIAAWALKTVAVLESSLGGTRLVHAAHLGHLRRYGVPPSSVRVVVARRGRTALLAAYDRSSVTNMAVEGPEGTIDRGTIYGMTVALRDLVLQVSGHDLGQHELLVGGGAWTPYLAQVWPPSTAVVLPPTEVLSDDDYRELAGVFERTARRSRIEPTRRGGRPG